MTPIDWPIFKGVGTPRPEAEIPPPPQWRRFVPFGEARDVPSTPPATGLAPVDKEDVHEMVSAAMALRRPLLVTGPPGCGKSVLAQLIAVELSLGPLLRWPITSSSRLEKALYDYDAIGRVHDGNRGGTAAAGIGRYIRLGPLGTALLPWTRPRVLLVDEIDKSDIDLPNDLLDVFESGEFVVQELARLEGDDPVRVLTADAGGATEVVGGRVRCAEFPVVVLTSNGERAFPPAFLRRCLRLTLDQPDRDQLAAIVVKRIPHADGSEDLLDRFNELVRDRNLATDQLLNAVFITSSRGLTGLDSKTVLDRLAQDLDQVPR